MDVIARLPGCAGQAADAMSAYTQVKMAGAPGLLKLPKSECPYAWMRPPRHEWPKSWSNIEDTVVPLARNLIVGKEILKRFHWDRNEDVPNWECQFVHRKQGVFLSVFVDDIKLPGKPNLNRMLKKLMKLFDLGEPASFLDSVFLRCTQRERKSNESIVEEDKRMFESRIYAGATEQFSGWEASRAKPVAWPYDMHGRSCEEVRRTVCQLTNKKEGVAAITSKRKKMGNGGRIVRSLLSQIIPEYLYLARIGSPDILWSCVLTDTSSYNGQELVTNA